MDTNANRTNDVIDSFVIDDRVTPRFRVDRRTLIDPDVFELERRHVFDTCWLYVGHESELSRPHDFRTRNVGGRPIIFCRDGDDGIHVFINACTHRGATLCREAEGNTRFLKCFYHAWSFDTTGALVAMPDDAGYGPDFDRADMGLVSAPRVDSYRGFVFACFDPAAVDLRDYLGPACEYLDLICDQSEVGMEVLEGSHLYSMRANWKLLVENSMDGYHGGPTHQRYFEMVENAWTGIDDTDRPTVYASKSSISYGLDLGGGHAVGASVPDHRGVGGVGRPLSEHARGVWEERRNELEARFGETWVQRMYGSRNLVIFPNLAVIDLVGAIVIRKIDPITPDYTELTAWELAPIGEDPELRAARTDNFLTFWGPAGIATPDDVEALECCQNALGGVKEARWNDISRGMVRDTPLRIDEWQMRAFWRHWNHLVTGTVHETEVHIRPSTLDGAGRPAVAS